eukprot:TRINITY_DN16955_c0_g1_i1.p1 TRINITY_DN16955_c0_g1~~TRINITY_DN16955_c0_g1_i1.p1  ORF type:complete len:155 (-),score=6.59 TRINITY_DN16955_c0_g1_i1:78-542(-)
MRSEPFFHFVVVCMVIESSGSDVYSPVRLSRGHLLRSEATEVTEEDTRRVKPAQHPTFEPGQWVTSLKNVSCDEACNTKNLECDKQTQSLINSKSTMDQVMTQIGIHCKEFFPRSGPQFPTWAGDKCFYEHGGIESSCDAVPTNPLYSRLCYCF